jgi:autophagy-related protein 5
MSLSKEDSTQLWDAVKRHQPAQFNPINQKLLNPQGSTLRHLPVRLYLPHAPSSSTSDAPTAGSLRVVQALVTPALSSSMPTAEHFVMKLTIPQDSHRL